MRSRNDLANLSKNSFNMYAYTLLPLQHLWVTIKPNSFLTIPLSELLYCSIIHQIYVFKNRNNDNLLSLFFFSDCRKQKWLLRNLSYFFHGFIFFFHVLISTIYNTSFAHKTSYIVMSLGLASSHSPFESWNQ